MYSVVTCLAESVPESITICVSKVCNVAESKTLPMTFQEPHVQVNRSFLKSDILDTFLS